MEGVTKHYLISGRVQGVGFRAFTQAQAQRLNLRGWVRNLSDARVEALVRGPTLESVESLEVVWRKGRGGIVVANLESRVISTSLSEEEFVGFVIRKDGLQPWVELA